VLLLSGASAAAGPWSIEAGCGVCLAESLSPACVWHLSGLAGEVTPTFADGPLDASADTAWLWIVRCREGLQGGAHPATNIRGPPELLMPKGQPSQKEKVTRHLRAGSL